ncbi:MAG: helix-turn-helix domain-containing protein [Prevotella sp.]|jgi:AraC-like DNA-binding protein
MKESDYYCDIDLLEANRSVVSVNKIGFFLCRRGTARIMLGKNIYAIHRNYVCFYAPNVLFQILEKSPDLEGILEELEVEECYAALCQISVRQRIQIRNSPCVELSEQQSEDIISMIDCIHKEEQLALPSVGEVAKMLHEKYIQQLKYAWQLKLLEVYFCNTPAETMPQTREDMVLNRFLVSLLENCLQHRTVQFYADQQHISPKYFSSIIKARSTKTAMEWIEGVTMTYARQYLKCTDMSIKEIAERMNFPDQSTFGRYFRQHNGCSPKEFKR